MDEAAKLLTLSKQTIYGLVSKSTIPHLKKGKRLYFLKKDLITWILQGKRKTQSRELDANIHNIINKNKRLNHE
ncbi:MAG: helix-turn-helix domain-containing protein [Saprospiraceae bacterium]|nr:helix-turn-helix domain-containing protein [Candidatus Brachybacter algidus]